jgi:hypothetical protein
VEFEQIENKLVAIDERQCKTKKMAWTKKYTI